MSKGAKSRTQLATGLGLSATRCETAESFDATFAAAIDRVYDGFINRVALGRKLAPARVRQIARGRVWTGVQAKQLGLVDEVGGLYQAVDRAKSLAGLTGEVRLKRMATHDSPFEALQRMVGVSATSARTLAAAAWIFGDPRAQGLMDEMAQSRLRSQGAMVLAPTRAP